MTTTPRGTQPRTMKTEPLLVDRRPAVPSLAARIKALGKTPAQVRAWAEQADIPVPRHGVDDDVVTAYEEAHQPRTQEDQPCPTPPHPSPKTAATSTSPTPSTAPAPPTPTPGTPTASATPGEAPPTTTPTTTPPPSQAASTASSPRPDGPTAAGARRAAARATTVLPEQPAPLAIPIDSPDPMEMAELGGVILWPHPARYITTPAPIQQAPVPIQQALAAAARLGGRGVPLARLVDYVQAVDAALPVLPAPCIVCGHPVTATHIARTGQPIHGDHGSRSGCWATYIERTAA